MRLYDELERRFRKFAIPGLMRYLLILYAVGMALQYYDPSIYWNFLCLDASMILRGQVWRLATFLIYPPASGILWGALFLFVYSSLGSTLETVWGTFRFNFFIFSGIIFHIAAALILYLILGVPVPLTPVNLNLSIFLAFALTFPEMRFYLYFVIPVKAKYMAIFYGILEGWQFLSGSLTQKITIVLSLLNIVVFFWFSGTLRRFSPSEMKRKAEFRRAVSGSEGGKIVSMTKAANAGARHCCAVCGKTEITAPELDFRYCSKCAGDKEYCSEHLYTHQHILEE